MALIKMRNGFTLIETLVVIAIVSIVGFFLFTILVNSTGLFYSENSKVDQGVHINNVLASINNNIKSASFIASGYPEASPTYTTSSQEVVLKLIAIDTSNNIIQNTYDYIVYYKDMDKLRYKLFPAIGSKRPSTDQILALSVDDILFQYFDSSGVQVSPASAVKIKAVVSLKQKTGIPALSNTATTEAFLRND